MCLRVPSSENRSVLPWLATRRQPWTFPDALSDLAKCAHMRQQVIMCVNLNHLATAGDSRVTLPAALDHSTSCVDECRPVTRRTVSPPWLAMTGQFSQNLPRRLCDMCQRVTTSANISRIATAGDVRAAIMAAQAIPRCLVNLGDMLGSEDAFYSKTLLWRHPSSAWF